MTKDNNNSQFMGWYSKKITKENFGEMLSLETFKNNGNYYTYYNKKFKKEEKKHFLKDISSNSSLRKIYDAYNDIIKNKNNYNDNETLEEEINKWFARVTSQEAKKILPNGFTEFLREVYSNLDKDAEKFRDFLEVFVAYHKYFNPRAS